MSSFCFNFLKPGVHLNNIYKFGSAAQKTHWICCKDQAVNAVREVIGFDSENLMKHVNTLSG
jgi:hypothetical protein